MPEQEQSSQPLAAQEKAAAGALSAGSATPGPGAARGLWSDAWHDLRRNPVFVVSALLIVFLGLVAWLVQRMYPESVGVKFGGFQGGGAREVGRALFTTYLLPFEVTSILVLIAIIGAIVLARKEID